MKNWISHFWKTNIPALVAGAISLFTVMLIAWNAIDRHRFIRCSDALVDGNFSPLSAQVPGRVKEVLVGNFERVKQGQLLARIDSSEFKAEKQKREALSQEAQSKRIRESQDQQRLSFLAKNDAVPKASLDQQNARAARAQDDAIASTAKLQLSQNQLDYTEIRAPADGFTEGCAITPGVILAVGDPLYGFVDSKVKWIDARMKETDLEDLRVGEEARVEIDAIPGKYFKGRIESLGINTEGQNAAVPADNSAGNYTKYVQRTSVRIALNLNTQEQEAMRIGLSAKIRVRRHHE